MKMKQLYPVGLPTVGPPPTRPFGAVPPALASVLWVSAAEGNLSAPGPFCFLFLFLVERCVTVDFGNGRAGYLDNFHLKENRKAFDKFLGM